MTTPAEAVRAAFAAAPRAGFLPAGQQQFAEVDRALPIGHGQTNSQPTTVATMLSVLDVRPGQRVLDVGCGSGWTTALLGHLVGPEGSVLGVELVPALVDFARTNLEGRDLPWVRVRAAEPGTLGAPDLAPYERILVSAEATVLPRQLVDQLAVGGSMVVPVTGELTEARRTESGTRVTEHGAYSFVPLVER